MHRARALDAVGTPARLGLAAVGLVSGTLEALDPDRTTVAVRAYDVLAPAGVDAVAAVLPFLELALVLLLLCGCFGSGAVEPGDTAYMPEILRDTGFLVPAAWLIARPGTLLSIDSRYSGRT